jgi:PAS domain S-box-containing protein
VLTTTAALIAATFIGFADFQITAAVDRPPLVLVGDKDYPPLTYLESGVPKGRDVDIAYAVARRLGRTIRIELMDWSEAQQRVAHGRADGLLAMSLTAERSLVYDFAEPILPHSFAMFVRSGDGGRPVADLRVTRIGVTSGGFPRHFLARRGVTSPALIRSYEEGFVRLRAGTLDAVAADTWVGAYTVETRRLGNIAIAGPAFATLPAGMAFKKGSGTLVSDVNRALRAMQADGTLGRIREQWRSQEVVFVSRQRATHLLWGTIAVFALLVIGGVGAWLAAIRKQRRTRKRLEFVTVTGQRRLDLLAHALQSANDCITITDSSDRILYVNKAVLRTYEYTEAELIGRHVSILRAGQNDAAMLEEMGAATRRDGWHGEIWNQSKTGRVFPASLSTSMVRDESGRVIATVGVARDVTQRKDLEERLRQAQKLDALGRLAAGIAHDFNNVLMVIMVNCDENLQRTDLAPDVRRSFADVDAAARGAAALTKQLLAFSRQQVVEPRALNLNDIVTDTQRMIARLAGPGVELRCRLDPALGLVRADTAQMQQLLINLAVNARDAMPRRGSLTIETLNVVVAGPLESAQEPMPAGDYVRLVVADTGVGMSDVTRARIFEPFFTTKEPGKGTGLGLSTVYGTVKQSGGFIAVASEPGHGTTFTMHFPRLTDDADFST